MSASSVDATPPSVNEPSRLGRVAQGSLVNIVGGAVSAICSFALVTLVARGTNRTTAGVFFSTTSLFLVVTALGGLGTSVGLVYFLARARALGRPQLIRGYLRAGLGPVLVVGVAASVAIYALAAPLARLTNPHHAARATDFLHVVALFVLPACLSAALLAATRGLGTMRASVLVEQVGRQLLQLAAVGIALAFSSVTALLWAWSLPYLAAFAAALAWLYVLHRRAAADTPAGGEEPQMTREFWRFTAPRALGSVVLLLIQRLDIVLVGALAGAVQAAVFTAGTRLAVAGQTAPLAVGLAIQPALAAAFARADHRTALHVFQAATAWVISVSWPLMLTFCVNGSTLLAIFGRGYAHGASTLAVVAAGMLVGSACGDVDSALTMSGRSLASLGNAALALAVMISVDVWLIPDHGSLGAAFGWAAAVVVKNVVGLVQVGGKLHVHPFSPATGLIALLCAACFGGVELAAKLLPASDVVRLVVGLAGACIAYVVGLWLLRRPLRLAEFPLPRRRGRAQA